MDLFQSDKKKKAEIRNVYAAIESAQSLSLGEEAGQYRALML